MEKWEVKKLFQCGVHGAWIPCGLNLYEKLWWRFMPGIIINVKWPRGQIVVGPNSRNWDGVTNPCVRQLVESADPNDHYRPQLEQLIGKQGRDWNWGMANNNVSDNRLTIKIKKSKAEYATILAVLWG